MRTRFDRVTIRTAWLVRAATLLASLVALLSCGGGSRLPAAPARPAPRATEEAADAGWLSRAQRHVEEREYWASENGEDLQAPNRRHALRSYFEPTGVRVVDRTAPGSPELLGLQLTGMGRGDELAAVAPGTLSHAEDRVEIERPGVREWFVNTGAGLEQGFTLEARPAGDGALVLEVAVAPATARLDGEAVALATPTGRRLRYDKLVAVDAGGAQVAARLEVPAADRIRLVVDDAGAAYPLTIDPLLTATADAQLESDQANALLGSSVAGAGDVNGDGYADVIVGANGYDAGQENEGAAFIFLGSPTTGIASGSPATAHAQLESDQANAGLGISVAGAGDVNGDGYADVVVGALNYDAGQSGEGAAFVFLGSATGIADGNPGSAHAQLESDQALASLGWSVAGAGDVNGDGYADVIVGADCYTAGETCEGAAFVFLGSALGIADGNPGSAHAQLESDQAFAQLGLRVAGAGDVNGDGYGDVIVGAAEYDAGQTDEGAAFVFLGSATGVADGDPASAHAQLESDQAGANLGRSVAGAGDVNGDGYGDVIVGAQFYDAGQTDEGAAFVFLGSALGIADGDPGSAHAQLESNQASAQLGFSVAGAGDVNGDGYGDVIVGANGYDAGETNEGAAFVFLGSALGVSDGNPTAADTELESDQVGASLGSSVAGAGDVNGDGYGDVIVAAFGYDAGQTNEGAAFVFLGSALGVSDGNPSTADTELESDQVGASLGWSVAGAGDVNGDGYGDVIVGAPSFDLGETDEGAAFVFLGSALGVSDGNPINAHALLQGNQAGASFGRVAGAGDVNGDGYADVIVGAGGYDAGETDEGAAFVFLGSAAGIADGDPASAHAQLESDQANARLGLSVAGAGDVNGDGYPDVIVGAQDYDAGETDEGAAFVFLGSAAGIADGDPGSAHAQLESDQAGAWLVSVAGAGDVNGDGYADVIVGARRYDAGETGEGAAFVFLGSALGIADGDPASAHAQLESNQANVALGSVAGAGDVNGDGYADVIVGAQFYYAGETDEGAAFVFLGSAAGIADGDPASAHAQLESDQANAWLGFTVAGAGDVNGDGYGDVIVGAGGYDAGETAEGAAFVFLGSAAGIADGDPASAHAQLESNQVFALFSFVAGAGDVNGDGFADVIVGAPFFFDGPQTDEGSAFVFLGNGEGRPVLARQRRGDASGVPVSPWGLSASGDGFEVELAAHHPAGSGRVKAELEACPAGLPFGHAGCTSQTTSPWLDVGGATPEVLISETLTGLANDTLYRWRARVLRAEATGPLPANPASSPWRRLSAQSAEADIRVLPLPEPGALVTLLAGIALLSRLAGGRVAAAGRVVEQPRSDSSGSRRSRMVPNSAEWGPAQNPAE